MPLQPGEMQRLGPARRRFGTLNGNTIDVYEIHFMIRGEGDYVAVVPIAGVTEQKIQAAMEAVAAPIIAWMDAFPEANE